MEKLATLSSQGMKAEMEKKLADSKMSMKLRVHEAVNLVGFLFFITDPAVDGVFETEEHRKSIEYIAKKIAYYLDNTVKGKAVIYTNNNEIETIEEEDKEILASDSN